MSDNINPYSLNGVLVAKTNADASSYNDPIDLYKDQMFTITPQFDTDQQRDSGAVTSSLAIGTHAEVAVQAGGIPFEALIMMMGASSSTSGGTVTIDPPAQENRPYYGAIGTAKTEDGRILAAGLYKIQNQADPATNFNGETNEWITSEMDALALVKASAGQYVKFKIYANEAAWLAAKPSDGAGMLAWFAA